MNKKNSSITLINSKRIQYYCSGQINKKVNYENLMKEIFKNVIEFDISTEPDDLQFYVSNYIEKILYKDHVKKDRPNINQFLNPECQSETPFTKFTYNDTELYLDYINEEVYTKSNEKYTKTGVLKKTTLKNAVLQNNGKYYRIILDYNPSFLEIL